MTAKVNMFDRLMFHQRLGRLPLRDCVYWRTMFSKILKVGEEFEVHIPDNLDRDEVYRDFQRTFQPTRTVDACGKFGVYDVTHDGSVPNGMELITVGRRFTWGTFYDMNQKIMNEMKKYDFYTSYHTGMHIHLLAGYTSNGISELEKNVPEIILANLYQLHRIFSPELFWISSSGASRNALTRYTLFRQPLFDWSAVNMSMENLRGHLQNKYNKYYMLNMNPCQFNGRELNRYHVEARYPDTVLSPAVATALVALEVAMFHKAVDLSQMGIIAMKQDEYDSRVELSNKFANLGTGDRESDTSEIEGEEIERLQLMSSQMVNWLKSELLSISPVAYEILMKLAVTPCSLLRSDGTSWKKIEEIMYTPALIDSDKMDKLVEIIMLQQVTDCESSGEWRTKVTQRMKQTDVRKINELLEALGRDRIVVWDRELGSMMFKQTV